MPKHHHQFISVNIWYCSQKLMSSKDLNKWFTGTNCSILEVQQSQDRKSDFMTQMDEAKFKNELTQEALRSCCMALKLVMEWWPTNSRCENEKTRWHIRGSLDYHPPQRVGCCFGFFLTNPGGCISDLFLKLSDVGILCNSLQESLPSVGLPNNKDTA